jgi:hypothetical protein
VDYPLGSFPRFGHQERWAHEQRERAIANSIATRQAMAARNLMVEREFYGMLDGYVQSLRPNCAETRAMASNMVLPAILLGLPTIVIVALIIRSMRKD